MERPILQEAVRYHRMNPNNQAIIKKFREEFNSQLMSVEWSSKRRRLEELGDIYQSCKKEKKHSNAIAALREMREEMEGKKNAGGNVNLFQYNYTQLTDEELDKKRLELVDLVQKHKILNVSAEENPEESSEISPES